MRKKRRTQLPSLAARFVFLSACLGHVVCLSACNGEAEEKGGGGNGGGAWECKGENCDKIPIPEGFPKSLVSAGKRTTTSSGGSAPMLVDGKFRGSAPWHAGRQLPSWAAIEVGGGIRELLLSWTASENTNHPLPSGPPYGQYGAPTAYRIETSANSTNGSDGDWALALPPITNNTLTARTHRIPFENQRWLRFVVLGDANTLNDGVRIHEIELHDNSDGKIDGWFFFGDSITAEAFNREASQNPAFATLLWAADQSHYPMQLNGGDGGDRAECDNQRPCSRDRLRQALDENDGIRVVALGLGTNGSTNTEVYRNSMRALIQEVQSRGKIAIIPRIPWANRLGTHPEAEQEAKNRVVDELTQEFGLPKGPDFYAHFKANPGQLRDNLHPNAQGFKEMNRLWAEAVNAAKAAGTFSKP